MRLSALSELGDLRAHPQIRVGLGETAPPHQPVEIARLAALRPQPAGEIRPGDGNETSVLNGSGDQQPQAPPVLALSARPWA